MVEQQRYALPDGHRQRLAATIAGVVQWRREKAREALEVHRDKRAGERSNRAAFALKVLHSFVVFSLPEHDPDLAAFSHSAHQGDHYQLCPEALELLSRFCMARGSLSQSGGKPTEAQMRNVLRRAEGMEQRARAEERSIDVQEGDDL